MSDPYAQEQQGRRLGKHLPLVLLVLFGVFLLVLLSPHPHARVLPPEPSEKAEAQTGSVSSSQPFSQLADPPVTDPEGYRYLRFDDLEGFPLKYTYVQDMAGEKIIAPGSVDPQIPALIRSLSGKKVAIRGFVIPITTDTGKVRRFILIKYMPECLYCNPPTLCDWVEASSAADISLPTSMQTPVEVKGTLAVGERLEEGMIGSIYQLKVDSLAAVEMSREVLPGKSIRQGHDSHAHNR